MGYDVAETFVDGGVSAKDTNRPAFQEMLAHCQKKKNNVSAIVVWKLDRLCRNLNDYHSAILLMLFKHNVKLLSVTEGNDLETASGELARNIWVSFAEYERKMIAQRVTAGMRAKAAKGIYPSKAPTGYRNAYDEAKNKIILIDESRAFFIRKTFELYATGAYTLDTLRVKLTEEGFNNGRTPITRKGIYTILKPPFYIGVIEWRGERFNNAKHKPIIKPSLFELFKDAPRLFKQASPEKKRILINLVQSNTLLKDEKLQVELKSVFYELAKLANFDKWYPQGNSNPCLHRERVLS